jgi:hypothetical protein
VVRARTSRLAVTPVQPRTIRRGSDSQMPNIPQQSSSPRISSHVPREMPVTASDRYAFHTDGVVWMMNDTVSAVPRPARPESTPTAVSRAAHPAGPAAARAGNPSRRASSTARVPARSVADTDGTRAVHRWDSAKYPVQAPLLTLVSAAHVHDTPAVSPVRRSRASCGRNCGTAKIAASSGSKAMTLRTESPPCLRGI